MWPERGFRRSRWKQLVLVWAFSGTRFFHCSHHPKAWWKSITKQRDPALGNHRTPRTPPHPSCRSYRLRTKASRTRQRKELALWPWRARGQRRKVRFKNLKIDGHKHGTTHSYVYCTVKKLGDLRNEVYEVTVLLINIQMHEMLQSGACPMDP